MPLPVPINPPAPLSLDPGELSINNQTRAAYVGVPIAIDPDGFILISALIETTAQIDLKADTAAVAADLALKANIISPAFTGNPTVPTQAPGNNSTRAASTAFVQAALSLAGGVAAGIIALWSGTIISIPAGWQLCNGTSGTPDLRNMFIVGAGATYSPGATGGAASVTPTTSTDGSHAHGGATANFTLLAAHIPAHTHPFTATNGGVTSNESATHTHTTNFGNIALPTGPPSGSFVLTGAGGSVGVASLSQSANHTHTFGGSVGSTGGSSAHQHNISTDGGHNHTVNVPTLPPFYALAFIMKLP